MANCTLLLLRKDDHILLAMKKRGFGAGKWNGVGGKIDPGETVEQALVRECQEEINVTPLEYEKVAYHEYHSTDDDGPWDQTVHAYLCTKWEGEPTETEEMAPRWHTITDIPYNEMWKNDQMWLPLVLDGKKVRAIFQLDKHDDTRQAHITVVDTLDQ